MHNRYQPATADEMLRMLEESGYWEKMASHQILERVRSTRPATIAPGGKSLIVSYWDEHLRYLCTLHRVVTQDGIVIHEHVKDVFLNGTRYRSV